MNDGVQMGGEKNKKTQDPGEVGAAGGAQICPACRTPRPAAGLYLLLPTNRLFFPSELTELSSCFTT